MKHNCDLQAYHRGGLHSGRFRDGFGTVSMSGSLGTVSGRFWVPKAEYSPKENHGSVRNSPRAAGHQISSIIHVPSRSFAALYPWRAFSEQTSLLKRQFWRVPADIIHIIRRPISIPPHFSLFFAWPALQIGGFLMISLGQGCKSAVFGPDLGIWRAKTRKSL